MENAARSLICLMLSAILSGALAHPATASISRDVQERKAPATVYLGSQLGLKKGNVDILAQPSSHRDLTQAITFRPGYSAEYNVRQAPVDSDPQNLRRRKNVEAERQSDRIRNEEDDSDMFMEPLELERTEVMPSQVEQKQTTGRPIAAVQPAVKDSHQMAQHFFPSFAPVFSLGHSRPHQLFHQEPFYNSKARVASTITTDYNPFRSYRDNTFKVPISFEDDAISNNILGSGNFGVLRGGTYYNEEDEYRGFFGPHYSNNGHGRPYYSNPRPQKYSNGDFFSNFRDFAEINTPAKPSFSQYIVVYINKNGTKPEEEAESVLASDSQPKISGSITKPKNIFEQLTLLDQNESPESDFDPMEMDEEEDDHEKQKAEKKKKMSLHKRKLALLKQEKLNKQKKNYYKSKETGKDFLEPLLALS